MKNITEAISYLPEHLVSQQMVDEAAEEGDIRLLNCLPEKFITPELVFALVEKQNEQKSYLRPSFDLSRVPQAARTKEVCLAAVRAGASNFDHTPEEHRDSELLEILLRDTEENMYRISRMPAGSWNHRLVVKGIESIVRSGNGFSSSKYGYAIHQNGNTRVLELLQVFLALVPPRYKAAKLYIELFNISFLSGKDIAFLTPEKYKQHAYYLAMAKKDLDLLPKSRYTYEHFTAALAPDSKSTILNSSNEEINKCLFEVMDDAMADLIISCHPIYFPELPKRFRTTHRLKMALENSSCNSYWTGWVKREERLLLTPSVCRMFIKKGYTLPEFVSKVIWTPEFIDYCMENDRPYNWIDVMPKELITQRVADYLLSCSKMYIEDIPAKFITYDNAVRAHREFLASNELKEYAKYIPSKYYKRFTAQTGLPKEFLGGEVSLSELREHKDSFTYCKLDESYLGIYRSGVWHDDSYFVILTRPAPGSTSPAAIFDVRVKTFHTTWLEKLIADNDPQYQKPTVNRELKDLLINPYYTLVEDSTYKGCTVYRNVLLGGTAYYAVSLNGSVVFENSLGSVKEAVDEYLK